MSDHTGSAVLSRLSGVAWKTFQAINTLLPEGKSITPKWSGQPLLKSYERSRPPLGFPRTTDSLCPRCVKEVRTAIINGEEKLETLMHAHPGEIKAELVEENGQILMKKTCPVHGECVDVISTDADFTRRIESLFYGRDFRIHDDPGVHEHGTSSIKYGRGAVLTVDLTNRCNMMCNPCFMDANQVGYVHQPEWEDIKAILDRAVSFKPRRQCVILFSGGEPTVSPTFLDACRYAKKVGFYRVLAATNGIRFAQDLEFTKQAAEAGLDGAYLQFDGATNETNQHRGVSNLFEVKLQALEHMYQAGMKATLVVTVLNGVNNDRIGQIVEFAVDNLDKVTTIAFQPVSFTGRDEDVDDETRQLRRYTLAGLTHDLKDQLGKPEPLRDWFPLSSFSAFTSVMDMLSGADAPWGWNSCNCHPNCGIFSVMVVNKRTKEWTPLYRFFNYEQFMKDIAVITDTARGKKLTKTQLLMSILRNYDASKAPKDFPITELRNLFAPKHENAGKFRDGLMINKMREQNEWGLLVLEGMWFQDLFNYDFRRTEMCVIPYGTQEGEISFCAYNTGVGWRQVIENMHMTASTKEWFKTNGRHAIYAGGHEVPLDTNEHTLKLREYNKEHASPAAVGGGCCGSSTGAHGAPAEAAAPNVKFRRNMTNALFG
jgi:uncharacterized radical SAM superfamily Fe-S cluster-containing enzyme